MATSSFGWSCSRCTMINEDGKRRCIMCRKARNERGGWSCNRCTMINDDIQNRCIVCKEARNTEEWACSRCTFVNKGGITCNMCHDRKKTSNKDTNYKTAEGINPNERRIVLIGKTGSGKSATGNSILNGQYFESEGGFGSMTKKCKKGNALRFGKEVLVVDTPGLFDTGMRNEDIISEIIKCISMTSPGPHAFILIISFGRFTKEEQDTVEKFADYFGEGLYRYLIVLFTRKDDILRGGTSIQQHVSRSPQELKSILERCGNRYAAIDNSSSTKNREADVKILLDQIERILMDNAESWYSSEMYEEAECALKKRMEEFKKLENEKHERARRNMEEQISKEFGFKHEKEMSILKSEHEAIVRKLNTEKEKLMKITKNEEERNFQESQFTEKLAKVMEQNRLENEKCQRRWKKEMEKERERHVKDLEKAYSRNIEPERLRKRARDECEDEEGVWPSLKSLGKGLFGLGKWALKKVISKFVF